MADITEVKLGVCEVSFNNVDLGHTKGGVVVSYAPEYVDIQVDKYGNTTADKRLLGEKFTAKVPLAESTLANLSVAMPAGTTTANKITLGSKAGVGLAGLAHLLVLHPQANEASDRSEDVIFYKAVAGSPVELGFTNDGVRIIEVTFEAMIDETKSDGDYLGMIGDSVV